MKFAMGRIKVCWLLLLLHLVVRISEGCSGISGTLGDIYPVHDQDVIIGSNYNLSCVLKEPGPGKYTSDDLFFTIGDRSLEDVLPAGSWEVTKANSSAIVLNVRNATQAVGAKYIVFYCKVREKPNRVKVVCNKYVSVGYAPADVPAYDFRCISENLASLVCTWQVPPNPIRTTYDLFYRTSISRITFHCPSKTMFTNGTMYGCSWSASTSPIYLSTHKELIFTMNITNDFGQYTQALGPFDHFANVRPAPPENLLIDNVNPRKAQLSFRTHYNLHNLNQGLIFDVRYRIVEPWLENAPLQVISMDGIDPKADAVNMTINLPHPHLHYHFQVRLKSYTANASAEYLWSNISEYGIQALPTVPERPPLITTGSFELVKQSYDKRSVYIFWKKLEDELKNGDGFHYEVEMYDALGRRIVMENSPYIRDAYVYYERIGNEACTFVVSAVNDHGRSENSSVITVPAVNEVGSVPHPRALTKISYDNGTYELAWNRAEGVDSYNLFWCQFTRDRPYPCDGFLNWRSVPADQNIVRIDVDQPEAIYQFAIASVSGGVSSGMRWATCTILSNNVFGKITELEVTGATSTSLSVKWKLECADSTGVIDEFRIYYCPYNLEANSCSGPNMTTSVPPTSDIADIVDLIPYTQYVIQISVITRAGEGAMSDPRYNQTLEGAPSVPTRVAVVEATNSSFYVAWEEPIYPNGVVLAYQVSLYQAGNMLMTQFSHPKKLNVTGLSAFTEYDVTVRACTSAGCSEESAPVTVKTHIGVPGAIRKPYIKYTANGSPQFADVEWGLPEPASGPMPHYRVKAVAFRADLNEVYPAELYDVGPKNYTNFTFFKCGENPDAFSYNISVQAYNPLADSSPLYGEWSKEVLHPCMKDGIGTTILIIVCGIVAFGIAFVGFVLGGVWIKNKYEESQSIAKSVQFPWGPSVPTLGKPPKEFQNGAATRGVKENSSQSSMKPLFQRINSDLSFTHIVESQTSPDTGGERRNSQSSVNSSGCSSAQDSEKSSQTRTRSRQSTDSGAFVNGSSGRSSREKLHNKHNELERSTSLGYQHTPPSYIQVPPGPPTLPGGYSRLGLLDTDIKSSPNLQLDDASGYVPYKANNQSSPTPSNRSTNSESSLLADHYVKRPEIVKAKSELSFGDFELLETGFGDATKSQQGYVPVPIMHGNAKALQPGYVQVGLEPPTGYVPVPVCDKQPKKSDYIQVSDFPKLEEPKTLSPGYIQVGFETPELSCTSVSPKSVDIKPPVMDNKEGYVHVGFMPEKTMPAGSVPVLSDTICQASNGYVTLDAVNSQN